MFDIFAYLSDVDDEYLVCVQFADGKNNSHSLRWEGVWRELSCLTRTTAFSVREQAGHSLKSALKVSSITVIVN